jgi:hypothetical protein
MAEDNDRYGNLDSIIDQVYGEAEEAQPAAETDDEGQPDEAPEDEVVETDDEPDGEQPEEEVADDDIEPSDDDAEDVAEDEETDDVKDDLYSKLVTVKVNGEEMQVSVEQAVKGYQLTAAANARFEEAARVRREAEDSVEFKDTFESLWEQDQTKLVAHFVSIADNPQEVVEAIILHAAATGALSPQVADALGITPEVSSQLALKHQREQLEAEREALRAQHEAANVDPNSVPDQHGFTVLDYRNAIVEIVKVAGLDSAPAEEQRVFVQEVFRHGDDNDIRNPYLAFAAYRDATARKEAERSKRVAKAVSKVAPATKAAAALSPKGQVSHSPTAPVINSSADAAEWALEEIQRKYGAS